MAGTIPLSMTQQFDVYGKPLSGGKLYIIQAGTVSTPQDAFQDTNLSIKQPYPMLLDQAGRVPQFFLADGSVKIRLQDKTGVVQLASDSVLVIGPSAGGGGGSPVDPTQLIQTGNMILRYGVGILSGYVRMNGLSIGSATSSATERANADCQNCFQYLWGADPNLILSPPRGTTAALDWAANKQMFLPDWRGYAVGALDDMGNSPSGRLGPLWPNPTTLGSAAGAPLISLTVANLPQHTHSGTTDNDSPDHTHGYTDASPVGGQKPSGTGTTPNQGTQAGTTSGASVRHKHTFTTNAGDGGPVSQSFGVIGPRKLCTIYIKL